MRSLVRAVALVIAALSLLLLTVPEADAAPKARASADWPCNYVITITGTQNIIGIDLIVDGVTVDVYDADGAKVRQVAVDPAAYEGLITAAVVEVGNGKRGKVETLTLDAPDCGPITPVTFSAGTYDVAAGDTFDVVVSIDPGSETISTVGFDLRFDPSLIRPLTVPFPFPDSPDTAPVCAAPIVGGPLPTCGPRNPVDTVLVAVIGDFDWFGPADVAVISFEALADVSGESPLELVNLVAQNPIVGAFPTDAIEGSVTVDGFVEPT